MIILASSSYLYVFFFLFLAWAYFSGGLNYQTEKNSRSNALQISSLGRPLQFLFKNSMTMSTSSWMGNVWTTTQKMKEHSDDTDTRLTFWLFFWFWFFAKDDKFVVCWRGQYFQFTIIWNSGWEQQIFFLLYFFWAKLGDLIGRSTRNAESCCPGRERGGDRRGGGCPGSNKTGRTRTNGVLIYSVLCVCVIGKKEKIRA